MFVRLKRSELSPLPTPLYQCNLNIVTLYLYVYIIQGTIVFALERRTDPSTKYSWLKLADGWVMESSSALSTTTHQETSTSIIGDNIAADSNYSSTNQHPLTSPTILNTTSLSDALATSSMIVYLAPYGPGSGEVYEAFKQGLIDRRRGLLQAVENILPTPAHAPTTAVSPRLAEVNKSESTPPDRAVTQNITINEHHHHHYYNNDNNQPPPNTVSEQQQQHQLNVDDTQVIVDTNINDNRKHRYIHIRIYHTIINH